jgi:hypothetical protein
MAVESVLIGDADRRCPAEMTELHVRRGGRGCVSNSLLITQRYASTPIAISYIAATLSSHSRFFITHRFNFSNAAYLDTSEHTLASSSLPSVAALSPSLSCSFMYLLVHLDSASFPLSTEDPIPQ